MTTAAASPTKLRDGTWGARVKSTSVQPGDAVTVTTQSGKSWTARVSRVLWSGEGVSIVSTESESRGGSARPARRESVERCYHGHTSPVRGCHDCFDTFDF